MTKYHVYIVSHKSGKGKILINKTNTSKNTEDWYDTIRKNIHTSIHNYENKGPDFNESTSYANENYIRHSKEGCLRSFGTGRWSSHTLIRQGYRKYK